MRAAWQSWKSAKGVAFLVVLAFAAGIGSSTAIYTVVNSLLLKPVPYEHGDRFVSLLGADPMEPKGMSALSLEDVLAYQQARSFDVFGWLSFANLNLSAPGSPQYLNGVSVTPGLVNNLGVNPQIGRWFRDGDGPTAAVISHALWQHLGGDPVLAGKPITLNGSVFTVTGIMPPGFNLPLAGPFNDNQMDVWLPLDEHGVGQTRGTGSNFAMARLRPGVTVAQADAEAKRIAAEIARQAPQSHHSYTARVDGLRQLITLEIKPILLLLFGSAELLLLITCANVGGLLLARSVSRARETAVRVALGARLPQLAAQYILEGVSLAVPGAAGGILLSALIVRVIVAMAGSSSTLAGGIALDWRAAGFALLTAMVAGGLTGLAPLWQAARTMPNEVLSEGVRASAGSRNRWLSQSLVVAEVALAFVLLAGSSVLVAELYRLTRVSPGFDVEQLLTFELTFARDAVPGKPSQAAYQDRLLGDIGAVPGVSGVAISNQLPLKGCCFSTALFPEGESKNPSRGERVAFLPVSPDYFHTMRIPLIRGRVLDQHDTNEKLLPVVINQAAVRRYWPDREPVGAFGHFNHPGGDRFQVQGVVGDVKNNGFDQPTVPEIYLPSVIVPPNPMNFVVRSSLPAGTLVPEVRRAIQKVNSGQPIHDVKMMSDIARDSMQLKRSASYVMAFFALAALLMAALGVYGVVSYSVRQRTVELGTRMALGAVGRDLLSLVVGSGLKMAAWGSGIGIAASLAAAWFVLGQFGIQNPSPLPFFLSLAVITAVALAASFFPAWSATLLSPLVAIRNEPASMWQSAREGLGQLFEGLFRAAGVTRQETPAESSLLTEFIEAARRADSFREALKVAMESLRTGTGAQTATLLEAASDDEFRATICVPDPTAPGCSIPRAGLLASRLRFHSAPLPISAEDLEVWQRWAAESKPAYLPEIASLRAVEARLAVPLRTNKETLGMILLGPPARDGSYGRTEIRLLGDCANHFALMLENARLTERIVQHERLQRDLALAAEVQKRMLPRQGLETALVSLAAVSLPARSVGGDYYDFLDLPGHRTAIALADVAGKGVAAALIMSVVQASLRVISADADISLPDLATKLNHFLHRSTGSSSYATFFYAQLDEAKRELRYVNAGHNPPYLLRAEPAKAVEELTTGGTIIGMFPKANYEEATVDLRPGDVLAVFTDGVPEAQNPAEEEFGEDRLKALLGELVHLPVEEMSSRISQELKDWIRDAPQYDDLTFVLMKVK